MISSTHSTAVPDGPPLSIQAISDSASSIMVSWSPPNMALQNGNITSYKLLHTADSSQRLDLRPLLVVKGTTLSHRLTSLQANTRYYISVAAATSIGFGPFATTSTVTLHGRMLTLTDQNNYNYTSIHHLTIINSFCSSWPSYWCTG